MRQVKLFVASVLFVCAFLQAKQVPADFNPNALWESLAEYQPATELPIVVVVPSYKNIKWYKKNLDSIFMQQYTNYEVIYLDDCSPDGTGAAVQEYVRACNQSHRVKVICNKERIGGIGNIYQAVHMTDDHKIMLELDGDDWFPTDHVLPLLNKVYQKYNPWLTYGELQISVASGEFRIGDSHPVPAEVIANNSIRSYEWVTSALRTWRAWLFKRIAKEDLMYDGKFLQMSWDQAFMLPMLEMAGPRIFFIPDVTYIYNLDNDINDYKTNGYMQGYLKALVRRRPRYDRLPDNFAMPTNLAEREMVVVIPSYKNKEWYTKNLDSVFAQEYTRYRVIYIDDCSPDGTGELVAQYVAQSPKGHLVTLKRNAARVGALQNIYEAVHSCSDHAVVVMLDGDDWFKDSKVLQKLNAAYSDRNTWVTYGQFELFPGEVIGKCRPYPESIVESNGFRRYEWLASHLRTCYAWLFKKIKQKDFLYQGSFLPMAWDAAIMFPLLEMAGSRARCISDVLYVYNIANPINDQNVDPVRQVRLERVIRAWKPYERLRVN